MVIEAFRSALLDDVRRVRAGRLAIAAHGDRGGGIVQPRPDDVQQWTLGQAIDVLDRLDAAGFDAYGYPLGSVNGEGQHAE